MLLCLSHRIQRVFIAFALLSFALFGKHTFAAENPRLAAAVVRAGSYVGNGVVIEWNGEPAILTNHHLVRGQTDIRLELDSALTQDKPLTIASQILKGFVALDIAVLSLNGVDERFNETRLLEIAQSTLQVRCPGGGDCRWVASHRPMKGVESLASTNIIARDSDGNLDQIPMVDPLDRISVDKDFYVSGLYEKVLKVPTFGRPGLSGSGVFIDDSFLGLVTIIHRDMASYVFAVPVDELARHMVRHLNAPLGSNFTGGPVRLSDSEQRCVELWEHAVEESKDLQYGIRVPARSGAGGGGKEGGKRKGGKGRSGGGDLSSGGSLANAIANTSKYDSRLWEIEFPHSRYFSTEVRTTSVLNPFHIADTFLEIDGRKILAIREEGKLKSATLARYCHLMVYGGDFELVYDTAANRAALNSSRHEKRKEAEVMRWLRIWQDIGSDEAGSFFVNKFPLIGGAFSNGVLDFSLAMFSRELSHPTKFRRAEANLQMNLEGVPRSSDFEKIHLHYGRHPDRFLSLLLEELQMGFWLPNDLSSINVFDTPRLDLSAEAAIQATASNDPALMGLQYVFNLDMNVDPTKLSVPEQRMLAFLKGVGASPVVEFIPLINSEISLERFSEGALVNQYASADRAVRAVAVFNSEDLSIMNRLILQRGELVYEASRCHQILSLCEFKDHPQAENVERGQKAIRHLFFNGVGGDGSRSRGPEIDLERFGR